MRRALAPAAPALRPAPTLLLAPVLLLVAVLGPAPLGAQPADLPIPAADGSPLPPGITVRSEPGGAVYADRRGRVLYGMDMRTVLRWAPDAAHYCTGECRRSWQPVLAPRGSTPTIRFPADGLPRNAPGFVDPQKAPDWTVIAGPDGPQWVYKGWHMVYVRTGSGTRSKTPDGADEQVWNTLKYVPARPRLIAPATVEARFVGGRYLLTDTAGRLLFTGSCPETVQQPCPWQPLPAPIASAGLGDWRVIPAFDGAQWARGGQPVYLAPTPDPATLPPGTAALHP